ncbi:hypothetical protein [Geobacillus sp. FSL K6-3411]|uniref:hypothetical protein n=1 Tax=Geobacillus sp. FSL K6-3411 TaxID=2954614 RepID=UPI0030D7E918
MFGVFGPLFILPKGKQHGSFSISLFTQLYGLNYYIISIYTKWFKKSIHIEKKGKKLKINNEGEKFISLIVESLRSIGSST